MTLVPFSAEELEALALRVLDLAATFRAMAQKSREHEVADFQLHGNKVAEWLLKVEEWAHDGSARLDSLIIRQRGARKARSKT